MTLATLPRSLRSVPLRDLLDTLKAKRAGLERLKGNRLAVLLERDIERIEEELQRRDAAATQQGLFQ